MEPMLATRGDVVPQGPAWVHEVKWDGMRTLVDITAGTGDAGAAVRARSRTGKDIGIAFPELQRLAAIGRDALLDGEVVVLGGGVPTLADLAERIHVTDGRRAARLAATTPVTLLAFDLLRLDGADLTARPWRERRDLLERLDLSGVVGGDVVQVPPTYDDGDVLLEAARTQGLEGVVSKRVSAPYRPGVRSRDWLKFPIRPTGSYLVGGFRFEVDSSSRLGAVLVGEPGPDGLVFRGRVGSGLAGRAGERLAGLLAPLVRDTSPFASALDRLDSVGTVWVEPRIVVDVEYLRLTLDGRLRQPAYRGVRTDLDPADLGS